MTEKNLNPKTKKRNRLLAIILVVVILLVVSMTFRGIYHADLDQEQLEHYNQNTETADD
jgi:flagellar basal body-associated protein FliL